MRWDDAVEGYWLTRRRSLSEATVLDYALTFRRFGAWIENGELKKVKPAHVNAFLEHLEEDLELAPKTVLNAWIALSSFWTWAQAELKVAHVMRQVARPKARPRPMQAFTEDEVRRLLAAATTMNSYDRRNDRHVPGQRPSSARNAAIVLLLVDAGLRTSRDLPLERAAQAAVQAAGLWKSRADVYVRALRGRKPASLRRLLSMASDADQIVKGARRGEAWNALLELTLALAGQPLLAAELS